MRCATASWSWSRSSSRRSCAATSSGWVTRESKAASRSPRSTDQSRRSARRALAIRPYLILFPVSRDLHVASLDPLAVAAARYSVGAGRSAPPSARKRPAATGIRLRSSERVKRSLENAPAVSGERRSWLRQPFELALSRPHNCSNGDRAVQVRDQCRSYRERIEAGAECIGSGCPSSTTASAIALVASSSLRARPWVINATRTRASLALFPTTKGVSRWPN